MLRFGFAHVPAEHYRKHVELVRLAEALGFDQAWIPDQTFFRDPYVILAALAPATSTIRLGLGVTNPFTRHPAMSARAIATVDELAPGRVALGIGAGNVRELLAPLGLPSSETAARIREMTELAHQVLTSDEVDYAGEHYRMEGGRLEFGPAAVPVYVAGRGPLVLEVAGEVADGALVGGLCTPAGIGYALDCIRRGAARRGRDARDLDIGSWVTCRITDDRQTALKQLQTVVAHIIGGAPDNVLEAIGLPLDRIGLIKNAYREGGSTQAAEHVTEECVDSFAIVGDAEACAARIRELEQAGTTQFILLMPPGTVAQHETLLRQFATDVMPALR